MGWKEVKSSKTLYNFLNSEDVKDLWWGHRYGELKSKEKFEMQFKTKLPTRPNALWYSDGTKLNYFYLDENNQMRTCMVYEVMDVASECFIGYHISDSENFEAQYAAYKMALQFAGVKPYQITFDNQGGHKKLGSANFLQNLSRLAIPTKPYNGKSKSIESAFGRFQSEYLKRDWFFTGMNIQTKKAESKANMEFILANKENLPTLEGIKKAYAARRHEWNTAKHPHSELTRLEMYKTIEKQNIS